MKWPDFGKHIETVTMEQGVDGVYRAVSDKVVVQEAEVHEVHSGCWVFDFLNDFGLPPEDHPTLASEPSAQDNPCKVNYAPDCDYQGSVPICPYG